MRICYLLSYTVQDNVCVVLSGSDTSEALVFINKIVLQHLTS